MYCSTCHLLVNFYFVLYRVCKIEDSRRRTNALIAEASPASHTHSVTPNLSDAVQRAKLALAPIRGIAPHPQPPITTCDTLPRSTGLSFKVPEGVLLRSSSAAEAQHWSEELGETTSPLEEKWLAGKSVTEQVRQQKEQFWLSLAKQGYVRPPGTVLLSGKEVIHNNQLGSGKGSLKNISKESVEEKFVGSLKKTGAPVEHSLKKAEARTQSHQQTQTKASPEDCLSSNMSDLPSASLHCSPIISEAQHSPSGSQIKLEISSSDTKQSVPIESQLEQNVLVDNTSSSGMPSSTESQSFPSYEGMSSPA